MDKWARAIQAAESVIEENLADVTRITIWLVGGTDGVATHLHCNHVDSEGDTIKSRFEIPEWIAEECETEKHMLRYAVEAITAHMMINKYNDKFE